MALRRGWQNRGDKGVSGISRLLGVAKVKYAPDADNPCYAADVLSAGRTCSSFYACLLNVSGVCF